MTAVADAPTVVAPRRSARAGIGMAVGAMLSVQLGLAVAVQLFDTVGPEGAVWLRLVWAGVVLLIVVRPKAASFTRSSLRACIALGVVTGALTMLFMEAVARLPLGTASALEFLGPLSVAVLRGRGAAKLWAAVAATGVLLLTQPWAGAIDPVGVGFALAAAVCWAAYIVLTQRVGDAVPGVQGLAVSLAVSALFATATVGWAVVPRLTAEAVLIGAGLAVLVPLVPFTLELFALRRLTTAAFGTLMSLEPAVALTIGFLVLGQEPGWLPVAGVAFVVAAGIGAERTGARTPD
ncbi:EamA family transporter [Spongisporangium articulatum]|uniref:EamA family transporter n=1 Tax=Spongisporangium articulatum TaxID=3362603 RepID=A0ABW8AJ05_9ACTN